MFKPRDQGFPFLSLCFSIIAGISVGTIVGIFWGLFVSQLVSTAHSFHSPNHWIDLARTQAYQLCYDGCGDSCLYPSIIADACYTTTKVDLSSSNIICDASKIWFWAERYPIPCLEAVGEIYKADALWWKKFWLRALYIFVPVFGLLASLATFLAIEWVVRSWERRPRVTVRRGEVGIRAPLLPGVAVAVLALAVLSTPAAAYPCPSYYPPYDKPFANANGTLYGVIHGWLSDCYDETYTCGESCTTSPADGKVTCSPISCTRSRPVKLPADFVNGAAWRVEKCGFRLVDAVPGVVDKRVPNPRIEGALWVKIAVSAFNSTDIGGEGLDKGVRCLYGMI
ncbi:uncharacterized protein BP5553_02316 [Venustampulla echinocandica]|uniref:Uncharacterized protein n=1 Tax=Venustampulla echinocandica TaxID=2656787 RepID=A0A370U3H7_9HELO|nr:uncharacterized protein BP5553_02316 [Venustampulla echinocandica]RDL42337.1 hypothetical protein BP5553_02316 [Venustampulla echinocandica]